MKKNGIARLISFAATGTIDLSGEPGTSHCHLSGVPSDPEMFCKPYQWWADPKGQLSRHWDNIEIPVDGVPVLDKRDAIETANGHAWVFKGPMLNVDLPEGKIEHLGDVSPIMVPVIAAYGMVDAVGETKQAAKTGLAGPLDEVPLGMYIQGWLEHGARLGRFTLDQEGNGHIEWKTQSKI